LGYAIEDNKKCILVTGISSDDSFSQVLSLENKRYILSGLVKAKHGTQVDSLTNKITFALDNILTYDIDFNVNDNSDWVEIKLIFDLRNIPLDSSSISFIVSLKGGDGW
jgi:hypothetical protein